MKIHTFKNEMYEFDLKFLIYDYSNVSQYDRLLELMTKSGIHKDEAINMMQSYNGFFFGSSTSYVVIDINEFDLTTYSGISSLLSVIQHECGHLRQHVLNHISEIITITDAETHLRISDWAFKKCLGTMFIKCLLKLKSK